MSDFFAMPSELPLVGQYQLLDCIGRGGMGLVYRARDTRLARDVAIKCLRTELFEPHYRERFRREALLLAKLNHPHIVHVYDFIETDDQLALVMELIDGQNLHTHLREHIVSMAQRLQWLIEIARGLAVAHDAGIIHRDLKAENILINSRNEAKISDLGIAKSQDFSATLTDHVTGSYASMSPEQAMGEPLNFKSDLFSFGILSYQLLCGAHPFGETDNKLQLMQRIISHPPIAPTKHNPDLPPEICDLLGQLLSKNIDRRPENAQVVANKLEQLRELVVALPILHDDTHVLPRVTNLQASKTHSPINSVTHSLGTHPTFDPSIKAGTSKAGTSQRLVVQFFKPHQWTILLSLFFLLGMVGLGMWYTQPQQPRYVAVLPPNLTATGMQESQQELVKSAVYDALQQSILQLDGYYLIPASDVIETQGDTEAVRRATAADELITAEIHCKVDSCSMTLSRLVPEPDHRPNADGRLRVQGTRTIDVLTDNYLSAAEIVQRNIGALYAKKLSPTLQKISDADYKTFLQVDAEYRNNGATETLLKQLGNLHKNVLSMSAAQTLFTEIALDLFYELGDDKYLNAIAEHIHPSTSKASDVAYQYNLFYLQIAQKKFAEVATTIDSIKQLNASSSAINELLAHQMLAQQDYQSAITYYKKSISVKATAKKLHYLSLAYWYSGNTDAAKKYLNLSLELSPNLYKSHELYGLIALVEGDAPRAITSFEYALAQKPNDLFGLSNLGVSYLLNQDYREAEELFRRALILTPDATVSKDTLLLNLADAKNLSGHSREAASLYQQVIDMEEDKGNISGLNSRAQAFAHLGKFTEALITLQQLERLDAQNINTTYTASLVHVLAGNRASALLNINNSLTHGMSKVWFAFAWFDSLCDTPEFPALMTSHGAPERCVPHESHFSVNN